VTSPTDNAEPASATRTRDPSTEHALATVISPDGTLIAEYVHAAADVETLAPDAVVTVLPIDPWGDPQPLTVPAGHVALYAPAIGADDAPPDIDYAYEQWMPWCLWCGEELSHPDDNGSGPYPTPEAGPGVADYCPLEPDTSRRRPHRASYRLFNIMTGQNILRRSDFDQERALQAHVARSRLASWPPGIDHLVNGMVRSVGTVIERGSLYHEFMYLNTLLADYSQDTGDLDAAIVIEVVARAASLKGDAAMFADSAAVLSDFLLRRYRAARRP
jgi:hypothetical protein